MSAVNSLHNGTGSGDESQPYEREVSRDLGKVPIAPASSSGISALSGGKKAVLITLLVLTVLTMLLMLGALIFLLATGGSLCMVPSLVSLLFFVSVGAFIISAVSAIAFQGYLLSGLKPLQPKPTEFHNGSL